jgi:cell wall-associated protease
MPSKLIFLFALTCVIISCGSKRNYSPVVYDGQSNKKSNFTVIEKQSWYHLDIANDTVPGISLERAYQEIIKNKKGADVIVALIDAKVNINHEDIRKSIWNNLNEIPNNGVDDDQNKYIDDVNGWNFIGATNGVNSLYSNFEITRIVRFYRNKFEGLAEEDITPGDRANFDLYVIAKRALYSQLKSSNTIIKNGEVLIDKYRKGLEFVSPYMKEIDFTVAKLDSLSKLNPDLASHITLLAQVKSFNMTLENLENDLKNHKNKVEKHLNVDFNDRILIGDDPNDLNDLGYGNNDISSDFDMLYHGTLVAGLIVGERDNNIGLEGFGNQIKIMPLCISGYGDEHDKDLSVAIRYAVDNGASVINISSSKEYSLYKQWVFGALKYAEKHNVLVVTSAGNDSSNLDDIGQDNFPNDTNNEQEEVLSNLIKVGGSGFKLDQSIKLDISNYGKNEVDVFAPGAEIYTTSATAEDGYETTSGTSFASPLVSGLAAIIYSYYPSLSVLEVKHIILESGVEYQIPVQLSTKENKNKITSFKELSKSGKIINVYNALIMAKNIKP